MAFFPDMKVGIALPATVGSVPTKFVDSLFCMRVPFQSVYIRLDVGGAIDRIRNQLAQTAIDYGCTHIAMLDTDQVYPADTLERLAGHRLPVVSAKVHRRYAPYDPILLRKASADDFDYELMPDDLWVGKELVEVDATGTGAVLYDIEVFKKIPEPWFEFSTTAAGKPVGEDICFCHKLKKAGYKIFVDCSIKVGHIKELMITEENYLEYKARGKK